MPCPMASTSWKARQHIRTDCATAADQTNLQENQLVQQGMPSVIAQHQQDKQNYRADIKPLCPSLHNNLLKRVVLGSGIARLSRLQNAARGGHCLQWTYRGSHSTVATSDPWDYLEVAQFGRRDMMSMQPSWKLKLKLHHQDKTSLSKWRLGTGRPSFLLYLLDLLDLLDWLDGRVEAPPDGFGWRLRSFLRVLGVPLPSGMNAARHSGLEISSGPIQAFDPLMRVLLSHFLQRICMI